MTELIRLNKRMAELGLCSRREADDWIGKGWVKVNGEVAVLGKPVSPMDRIEVDKLARGQQDKQVTILLHKPMGYVSGQAEDGHTPAINLIEARHQWRDDRSSIRFVPRQRMGLAPAGRLDIDSVGLLVLTQDGRVARQLIGEDSQVEKEYLVRVQYGKLAAGEQQTDVQSLLPSRPIGAFVPRPALGRPSLEARRGGLAKPRATALCVERRPQAPNSAHVRAGRPDRGRLEAGAHWPGEAGPTAGGAVAVFGAWRGFLKPLKRAFAHFN
jgi:23S rRNA pseudouridine2604 synthase